MDTQANYDELIATVFKNAYDELVVLIRKAKREEEKKITAPTTRMREENGRKYRNICSRIVYIEGWIRKTMPQWLDISPEQFIRWAHKEADDE